MPVWRKSSIASRGWQTGGSPRTLKEVLISTGQPVPAEFSCRLHRIAALGHGALAYNLSGDDKVGPEFWQEAGRFGEHESVAVDAGIEVFAESVDGFAQHLQMSSGNIYNSQLQAVFTSALHRPVGSDIRR